MNNSIAENKERAKSVPIALYLLTKGHKPVSQAGKELVYYSPLRNENTPSFSVNTEKNVFIDFGASNDCKGDSIRLVQLIESCAFFEAIAKLLSLDGETIPDTFSFSGKKDNEPTAKGIQILSANPVAENSALMKIVRERGHFSAGSLEMLYDILYMAKGRKFRAVGFQNDSGGYELTNGKGRKFKSINDVTTILGTRSGAILFEGFWDYLSAREYYGDKYPAITTIILHSVNNIDKALRIIPNGSLIQSFLDNDDAGRKTLNLIQKRGFTVHNVAAKLYFKCKDFNDFYRDICNNTRRNCRIGSTSTDK